MPNSDDHTKTLDSAPTAWSVVGLLDVVELPIGQVDPRKEPFCHWPLVAPNHIEEATGRLLPVPSAAEQQVISGKYVFGPTDILYSKIRPYLRKAAFPRFSGLCSADMYPLRTTGRVYPGFLLAVLLGDQFTAFATSVSMRTGIPKINREELAHYHFALPPFREQERIADILSSVDDAIEATQAVIDQLQFVKKVMMAELLTRGLPGRHTRFKQTEIGEVPDGWQVCRVDELGIVKLGRMRSPVYTSGQNRPYLRVANVLDGEIDSSDVLEMPFEDDKFEDFRLMHGDILLNEGQSLNLVGRSAIYRGDPPDCAFQKTLLRFRATRLDVDFAHFVFQHYLYNGRFAANAVQTTSIAHLTGVRFAAMWMPVPKREEQQEIARLLGSLRDREWMERQTAAALGTLKSCLASVLLTGDLRVTPDEAAT